MLYLREVGMAGQVALLVGVRCQVVQQVAFADFVEEMQNYFRPEFLNRVDEMIIFHALSEEHLTQISDIRSARLRERLQERRITIELTEAAKEHLVRVGYDPVYGARPLKRWTPCKIEMALVRRLLRGEIRDGDAVLMDYDTNLGTPTFTPAERALEEEPVAAGAGSRD